ncbi:MAG: dockerin type I domain-containing protein, partial [Planctomycetes bacterium]|nr:dockerin type I domain-containing protein [Planctomycetota bacterium]
TNAAEPHEPTPPATIRGVDGVPSGDGIPGGDFVARFTIDSRPEVAVYHSGTVWADTNGNFRFDPDNLDYTNRDITYVLGVTTDDLFVGNFSDPGAGSTADGFDKLAAYGRIGNNFRWLIDTDNDGVPNPPAGMIEPLHLNGLPVAGNFDGDRDVSNGGQDAINGDEVGLLVGSTWYFDTDHDYQLDSWLRTPKLAGLPIVGDFDGNGIDDLATWRDDGFTILFNPPAPGPLGAAVPVAGGGTSYAFGFIGVREMPLAADMDMDGIDDLGLWVPDRAGVAPTEAGEWYFLVSGGTPLSTRIAAEAGTADFKPVPFGNDMYASFGDEFAIPLVGNFDPPVTPIDGDPVDVGHTNSKDAEDVNDDGIVSAQDALTLINDINSQGIRQLDTPSFGAPYLDVNGDGTVSAADVVQVINRINLDSANSLANPAGGEGEWSPVMVSTPMVPTTSLSDVATTETVQGENASSELAMLTIDLSPAPSDATSRQLDATGVDRVFAEDAREEAQDGRYAVIADDPSRLLLD